MDIGRKKKKASLSSDNTSICLLKEWEEWSRCFVKGHKWFFSVSIHNKCAFVSPSLHVTSICCHCCLGGQSIQKPGRDRLAANNTFCPGFADCAQKIEYREQTEVLTCVFSCYKPWAETESGRKAIFVSCLNKRNEELNSFFDCFIQADPAVCL